MSILSFLGNSVETVGMTFQNIFSFLTLNILIPFIVIIMVSVLILMQYLLIKMYIWIFTKGQQMYFKGMDILKLKSEMFIQKILD